MASVSVTDEHEADAERRALAAAAGWPKRREKPFKAAYCGAVFFGICGRHITWSDALDGHWSGRVRRRR